MRQLTIVKFPAEAGKFLLVNVLVEATNRTFVLQLKVPTNNLPQSLGVMRTRTVVIYVVEQRFVGLLRDPVSAPFVAEQMAPTAAGRNWTLDV